MNTSLEIEILDALEKSGYQFKSSGRISHFLSTITGRVTYRIDHANGIVKARLLEDEETAQKLVLLRTELDCAFAPVLFRHGRVLIESWIEGDRLPEIPQLHHLATAGALLGEMHSRSAIADQTLHNMRSTENHILAASKSLRMAVASGALEEGVAAGLERTLRRLDPLQTACGLVHLDFCGDNMIIDRAGRLRIVDNERICLDSLGYDLGRTWYRWPLPAQEWDAFCRAYAARMQFPDPPDSLPFWKIVAAAGSAELRLRACPERADVPLRCLRALAAEEPYEAR